MHDIKSQNHDKDQTLEYIVSLGCDAVRGILMRADNNNHINELNHLNSRDSQFIITELRFLMDIKDS